jgi:23S rRNA pseudouridine2605 synthase
MGPGSSQDGPDTARETEERLQRTLARLGFGSRRSCEILISAGRVKVNGLVATLGSRVSPERDKIEVDDVVLASRPDLVCYLLNKPAGVVTTASDPQGRPKVVDLVPPEPRVFPVGRLDAATEGLLILTNDGPLAHRLTHPSFGVDKEYLVEVSGVPTREELRRLRQGVELDDGKTGPARVGVVAPGVLRVVVHEGRNRLVRRMCEAIGHPVRRLVRTRFGPISDPALKPGRWRKLSGPELRALQSAGSGRPTRIPTAPDPTAPDPTARNRTARNRPPPE